MSVLYNYRIYQPTGTIRTITVNYLSSENIDLWIYQTYNYTTQLDSSSTVVTTQTTKSGLIYKYKDNSFNNVLNNEKITATRDGYTLKGFYNTDTGYFELKRNVANTEPYINNSGTGYSYTITENSVPDTQSTTFDIDLSAIAILNNCTLENTSISGNYGDSKTIAINANTGYVFNDNNLPTITIDGTSYTFTLNSAKTKASYTLTINSDTIISSIVATVINLPDFNIDLSAIATLSHCTLEDNSISGNYGDSKTIKINTDSNYFFSENNIPTIIINGVLCELTLNSAKTKASYTLTINSDTVISSIIATAILFNYYKDLSAIATLVQCSISPTEINSPLNTDVTITITASSNYYFSDTPTITINEYLIGWQSHNFTLNNDRTVGTYIYHIAQYTADIEDIKAINGNAIPQTVISDKYGLITLYKPTSNILQGLPEIMLYYKGTDLIDLSQYITNFISLPLDVETIGTKTITFNGIDTEISSPFINDNIVSLDFGTCNITGFYNNSIDINNCEVEIYLPYLSNQKLDTSKVMNKTIHLVYKVDLFTGDFIAIIKIDTLIIYTFTGNMAIKIPYIIKTMQGKNTSIYDSNSLSLLDDREPKIIVNENIINNNSLYIDTVNYCKLDTLTGYNVINDIELDENNILSDDIETIKNILASGVIF